MRHNSDGEAAVKTSENTPQETADEALGTAVTQAEVKAHTTSKVALLESSQFSLSDSLGGVRGVLESVLPTLIFMVAFVMCRQIMLPSILAAVACSLFVLARLIQRQNVTQALVGLLLVAISGWAAYSSHDARNFYTPGFVINAAWTLAILISLLTRTPAVGVVVELVHTPLTQQPSAWRRSWVSVHKLYRVYRAASWLWLALFAVRLAVELPLWLTHHVDALGIARLLLGIPAFALVFWLTWVLVSPQLRATQPQQSSKQSNEE